MDFWILTGLGVFLLQTYVTASLGLMQNGLMAYVGPRDRLAEPGAIAARAERALANMRENMFPFLALALLVAVREPNLDADNLSLAELGAGLFVLARLPYALAYVWGVPWVRSLIFGIGLAGLALMMWALM